jgi:uncharacterized linocin/CFP29 family protein
MMENKYLGREDAPIAVETFNLLDTCMVDVAKSQLTGRKLIDIEGPFGFGTKGIPLGDYELGKGVMASGYLPLTQIKSGFCINRRDLASFEKGTPYLDTKPLVAATLDVARMEDQVIFEGMNGCTGLMNADGTNNLGLSKWDKVGSAADQVISAVTKLDEAGFHGPYCMALAPSLYNLLMRRYPQGEGTELDHISGIVTGGVVKAPALVKGGILMASGTGYASIIIGQDMCIGYLGPSGDTLDFYVTESLALLIREPSAICVLK